MRYLFRDLCEVLCVALGRGFDPSTSLGDSVGVASGAGTPDGTIMRITIKSSR